MPQGTGKFGQQGVGADLFAVDEPVQEEPIEQGPEEHPHRVGVQLRRKMSVCLSPAHGVADDLLDSVVELVQTFSDLGVSARVGELQEQPGPVRVFCADFELAFKHLCPTLDRILDLADALEHLRYGLGHPLDVPLQEGKEQLALARKVPVDGSFGHSSIGGHHIECRPIVAVLREYLRGGREDATAGIQVLLQKLGALFRQQRPQVFLVAHVAPDGGPAHPGLAGHFGEVDRIQGLLGRDHTRRLQDSPPSSAQRVPICLSPYSLVYILHTHQYGSLPLTQGPVKFALLHFFASATISHQWSLLCRTLDPLLASIHRTSENWNSRKFVLGRYASSSLRLSLYLSQSSYF